MFCLVESLRAVAGEGRAVLATHADWMIWNTLLAFVPLVLAVVLFREGTRRTWPWRLGLVAFIAFLPNAPYVLTDVVHLFEDIRRVDSDLKILLMVVPLYATFFVLGFGCYVLSLQRLRGYLAVNAPRLRWWIVAVAIHGLCSVGLYLGRVLRFNSWDIVVSPGRLIATADDLATSFPIFAMVVSFVVLAAGTALGDLMLEAADRRARVLFARGRTTAQRFGLL